MGGNYNQDYYRKIEKSPAITAMALFLKPGTG